MYVHRLGSCEKAKWRRFHFRVETCATGATQKADSRCRFSPCFGTCAVDTRNLRRLSVNLHRLLLNAADLVQKYKN